MLNMINLLLGKHLITLQLELVSVGWMDVWSSRVVYAVFIMFDVEIGRHIWT